MRQYLLTFSFHFLHGILIFFTGMHGDRRDEEAVAYMSNFDQVDMGIEFPPYEEPPPPYTPPKPPDIPQGEAPPPYTLTPNGENSSQRETNNNNEGNQPGSGRGGRPLQGMCNNSPAVRGNTAVDPSSSSHVDSAHPTSAQDDNISLSISRSNREIMAHTEALTPPGGPQRSGQSPVEPEYENLRNTLHEQHSVDFSSAAETESVMSSPDFSPESLYPAALAASFNTQASPSSQVMVRMHNDSPQSHLVRASTDVMTTSAPPCLGGDMGHGHIKTINHSLSYLDDNKRPFLPSYRTHFLKRSDSVEIKYGSNSPRNSFYQEEGDGCKEDSEPEAAVCGPTGFNPEQSSPSGSPESDRSSGGRSKSRRPQVPNVTWNKSCRPFRIRLGNEETGGHDQETERKERYDEGVNDRAAYRHSSYIGTCGGSPSPPSTISHRNSLPPMELDLPDPVDAILGASGTQYRKIGNPGCSGGSSDPSPSDGRLEVGRSPTGSGKVSTTPSSESSPLYEGSSIPNGSAPHLSPNTVSPQSPMEPSMVRSGSITSQISQFSVCSETGEKKRPKPIMSFPRSLRNDTRYPLSPFSSNYAAPMNSVPPMSRSRGQAKRPGLAGGSRTSGSLSASSPCESSMGIEKMDQSPTEAANPICNSQPTAANSINVEPRPGQGVRLNMISYVDASPERELSDSNTPSSSTDSSSAYPKQPTSPMTNDSTMSSLSPLSPDGDMYNQNMTPSTSGQKGEQQSSHLERGELGWPEKPTVRRIKRQSQRKRHSRGNTNNIEGALTNGMNRDSTRDPLSHSPERHRRVSRTVDASTKYKQYGFIDDPDILNNARDVTGNVTVNNGSLPRNYNLRRQNSREKRDNSQEHRNHSAEGRREHSGERRRSRERQNSRERRDNSRERQSGRSKERSRDRSKRDSIKGTRSRSRDRQQRTNPIGRVQETNGQGGTDGDIQMSNRTLTIEVGDNGQMTTSVLTLERQEGRKRERDYASQGASLERRKKRRSTGEIGGKSTNATYPVTIANGIGVTTNGHVVQPMDCEPQPQHQNDASPEKQGSKRSKNNRTHENRHSLPMVVHRNR